MSGIKIMLPTELPTTRTCQYPSTDRSVEGLGLSEVGEIRDPSGNEDSPLKKSGKRTCSVSEGEEQDEGWNDVEDLTRTSTIRKRHRRGKGKKRKWKPYYKLSWQERRELDEREAQRANHAREARFAHGQPVAPYNTTQFLMDDHNVQELDLSRHPNGHRARDGAHGHDSSDDFYSSPEDEEEFLQKQFSEAYENVHAERLNGMSKAELVKEYMELEERVEVLEEKLKEQAKINATVSGLRNTSPGQDAVERARTPSPPSPVLANDISSSAAADSNIRLLAQNEKLKIENELLRTENELLRTMLFPSASP